MRPLVNAAQMQAMDRETIQRIGLPGAVLMENAGRAVADRVARLMKDGTVDREGWVVVVAGPGNNGGDGMVIARTLHNWGLRVRLLLCAARERVRGDALLHLSAAEACGVEAVGCEGEAGVARVGEVLSGLSRRELIVDALLGTGLSQPVTGPLLDIIQAMNRSPARRLSVDLPSGLDADRGIPTGAATPAIVRADHTVTFAFPKLGLCTSPGYLHAGELSVADIGIPAALCEGHGVRARLLDESCLLPLITPLLPLEHKGSHGHLLIIAGSGGKSGAALLCVRGAMQVGVGLCTLASPPSAQAALQGGLLEAMSFIYGTRDRGRESPSSEGAMIAGELIALCESKQAIALGPGMPTGEAMKQVVRRLLAVGKAPMVLDADALNMLAGDIGLDVLKESRHPLVLTPHPGEAARLLQVTNREIQDDRLESARKLCRGSGAVVVLKGARTVIVGPCQREEEGRDEGDDLRLSISPTGNGGMGSGGMGDVLTGMIGALLCRGFAPYEAACTAVYLHGLAGDVLAAAKPPGTILLAGELAGAIPDARRAVAKLGGCGAADAGVL